jgi:hypothetical protein
MKRPHHGRQSTTPITPTMDIAPIPIHPVLLTDVLPVFQQPPTYQCPKLFIGIEEHCLEGVYEGRSRLSKSGDKLIMDLIWFQVKKQLERERACIL